MPDLSQDTLPPSEHNATNLDLSSGAASTAQDIGAATGGAGAGKGLGVGGRYFCWICTKTHNVRFSDDGTSTVTDPATKYYFAANVLYSVRLSQLNTHFKATASADGSLLWWIGSRA